MTVDSASVQAVTDLELINLCVQLAFNYSVFYFFGAKSLCYLLIGFVLFVIAVIPIVVVGHSPSHSLPLCRFVLGLGPHPLSGHFIAEHYTFRPGQETYRHAVYIE